MRSILSASARCITGILLLVFTAACGDNYGKGGSPEAKPDVPISGDISNQRVNSFIEDKYGHIWIATFRGLNCYNGDEFLHFFKESGVGLPHNEVYASLRDSSDRLWWSTTGGICYYTEEGTFKMPGNGQLPLVRHIAQSPDGRIFFCDKKSVYVYDYDDDVISEAVVFDPSQRTTATLFFSHDGDMLLTTSFSVRYYDSTTFELKRTVELGHPATVRETFRPGLLWFAGRDGLYVYDIASGTMSPCPGEISGRTELKDGITNVYQYSDSHTVICSSSGDIFVYDLDSGRITVPDEAHARYSSFEGIPGSILRDHSGNIWYTTGYKGYSVLRMDTQESDDHHQLKSSMSGKSVLSIAMDTGGRLWMATDVDGIYLFDGESTRKVDIIDRTGTQITGQVRLFQMASDSDGDIWISSNLGVMCCRWDGRNLHVREQLPIRTVIAFTDDGEGHVWMGGYSPHLHIVDKRTFKDETIRIAPDTYTLTPALIRTREGILAGTYGDGVSLIDVHTLSISTVADGEALGRASSEPLYVPTCLYEDSRGILWIGTDTNGLLRYDRVTGEISHIGGAPCENISSITEDPYGGIWVGTQFGLGRYSMSEGTFTNYYSDDGIGENQFLDRASATLPDGHLVFGGTHGITIINPANVSKKREVPLTFENLKVNNATVYPGADSPISRIMAESPDVDLRHDQNSFSVSYAAHDYGWRDMMSYSYMLEGYNDYWIDAGKAHEAFFSNVRPGRYVFRVKIGGNVVADNERALNIRIRRSPMLTGWAILAYSAALIGTLSFLVMQGRRFRRQRDAAKKAEEEKMQERRINRMNIDFFANIAHEFRTPLSLISGPVSLLKGNGGIPQEDRHLLDTIERSVSRMLRLVDQTLDIGRLENETLPLKVSYKDVIPLLKGQVDLFRTRAEMKGIFLETYCQSPELPMWLDEDKFNKITGNLLSNACKFTPGQGIIIVSADTMSREEVAAAFGKEDPGRCGRWVRISVTDTGPGIPPKQLEKIFERYYQVEDTSGGTYNYGTGIGLYYTKALVSIHHGFVKASNREAGNGSVFSFALPAEEEAYALEEKETPSVSSGSVLPQSFEDDVHEPDGGKTKTILVVDDDIEVTGYMSDILSPEYRVETRFDAESAIDYILKEEPDLVVSDVYMPGKDGYDLCREIKGNPDTSHLPVIMVTAKVTVENQIRGFQMGADAYVTKPFDPYYLRSLIRSILDNRDRIRSMVRSSTNTEAISTDALSEYDSLFLKRLYKVMDEEMTTENFDAEAMAVRLDISRSKLFYKVKGLTGKTPMEFFREYRLNRAADFLRDGRYNVSQVSYMTGFSSPSKFSPLFKKQFGVNPSSYKGDG